MKTLTARKKKYIVWLDQAGVLKVFFIIFFSLSEFSNAAIINNGSGATVGESGNKITYFYNPNSNNPSSYVIRNQNNEYFVAIKRAQDSYQFRVKSGIIVEAVVEKRFKKFRAIASFYLSAQRYHLKRVAITNRYIFGSEECPTDLVRPLVAQFGEISDNLVESGQVGRSFVDKSCDNLIETQKLQLGELKNYFNQAKNENKNFVDCLKNETLPKRIQELEIATGHNSSSLTPELISRAISLTKNSILEIMLKNENVNAITIGCKKTTSKDSVGARFNLDNREIDFLMYENTGISSKDMLTDEKKIDTNFLHELVHSAISQPSECKAVDEEYIAQGISQVCHEYTKNKDGGGSFLTFPKISNPAEVEPNMSDSVAVAKKTEISLAAAVDSIPPQKIDPASISFSEDMIASDSAPKAKEVYQDASAPAMRGFSIAMDGISSALIPRAEAQVAQLEVSNPKAAPVVEQAIYAEPTVQNPARLLEQDTPPMQSAIATSPLASQKNSETLRAPASEVPVPKKDVQARSTAGISGVGVSANMLPIAPAFAGSSYDRELKQQLLKNDSQDKRVFSRVVDGVTFTSHNLTGPAYQKYSYKIDKDQVFVSDVAENQILISKNGKVITKTKKVDAFYVDTGQALVYRNGSSQ